MDYSSEVAAEEGVINSLRNELRHTRIPARTINWQHNNIGQTRGITQRVLVTRKARSQIRTKIQSSESRITSLRKSIFGIE